MTTTTCPSLSKCGFFMKHQQTKDLVCRGFISMYCQGPKMDECKRAAYKREHGVPPADDMMPSGQMIRTSI